MCFVCVWTKKNNAPCITFRFSCFLLTLFLVLCIILKILDNFQQLYFCICFAFWCIIYTVHFCSRGGGIEHCSKFTTSYLTKKMVVSLILKENFLIATVLILKFIFARASWYAGVCLLGLVNASREAAGSAKIITCQHTCCTGRDLHSDFGREQTSFWAEIYPQINLLCIWRECRGERCLGPLAYYAGQAKKICTSWPRGRRTPPAC